MDKVFLLDFDGTIAKKDVVAAMVLKFCRQGWQELNDLWEQGLLSTEECANQTFALFDANIEDIYQLLDTIELDDYFNPFVQLCQEKKIPIYILSDGYEPLIKYILQRQGFNLPVYANKLLVLPNNRFSISCTYSNPECNQCGTCKKQLLYQLADNKTTVYVGDGYSDMCVCHHADVIFAKKSLLEYCHNNNLPAIPYNSFKEIIDWLNIKLT